MANYTGSSRGRVAVSNLELQQLKYVTAEEVGSYLQQGWVKGNCLDHQKAEKKRWYNNGTENLLVKEGEDIPEGFVPGMYNRRVGGFAKFQYKWYTNGKEQKRLSLVKGDIIPEGWWEGQSDEMAEKSRNAPRGKKRTLEQREHHKIGCQKAWQHKIEHGTFNTSQPEEQLYIELVNQYGVVYRQYKEDRYPWHCDFYIPSEDLFIELNRFPTHYTEPFDETNQEHLALLEHCKTNPSNWVEKRMVTVWAGSDVKKRKWAKEHNLNFKMIY